MPTKEVNCNYILIEILCIHWYTYNAAAFQQRIKFYHFMKRTNPADSLLDVVLHSNSKGSPLSYLSLASSTSLNDTSHTFQIILNLLSSVNTQLMMGATETPHEAMSLMMVLYNLLSLHPIACQSYLNDASNALQPITKWPSPHGDVKEDTTDNWCEDNKHTRCDHFFQ